MTSIIPLSELQLENLNPENMSYLMTDLLSDYSCVLHKKAYNEIHHLRNILMAQTCDCDVATKTNNGITHDGQCQYRRLTVYP